MSHRDLTGFDLLEYSEVGDSDGEYAGIDYLILGWRDGSTYEIASTEEARLAKLFVAAPDLYEALKQCLAQNDSDPYQGFPMELRSVVEAALAKASGEVSA